jgi:hypothetical protein
MVFVNQCMCRCERSRVPAIMEATLRMEERRAPCLLKRTPPSPFPSEHHPAVADFSQGSDTHAQG